MSFDEIFDLTAGVYFNFYNMFDSDPIPEFELFLFSWHADLPGGVVSRNFNPIERWSQKGRITAPTHY